ncbi:EamA family transporter [Streptomyces tubbatahanensis]|uniref:EamA family transporter n=1 Tax=Streptomyces tubbatahanensis TaxID=2923272 RepID=UPI00237CE5EF|nr:EamA family transporter [Streptomyces tubbatahanensis]
MAPVTSAALLLLQPVLAVLLGVLFLGERPTATQFAGCALVVLTVWHTSRGGAPSSSGTPPPRAPVEAERHG